MSLKVVEKFFSLQGEGSRSGVPAVFIRLQDCVLACPYCDSKFASRATVEPKYVLETKEEVDAFADLVATAPSDEVPAQLVVITGGEPLMKNNLPLIGPLIDRLQLKHELEVNFETTLLTSIEDLTPGNNIITNCWKIGEALQVIREDEISYMNFNAVVCPKFDLHCYPVTNNLAITEEDILDFYAPKDISNVNNGGFPGLWFFDTCEFKIVFDPGNEQVQNMILRFLSRWEDHSEYLDIRDFVSIMPMTPIQDFTREKYVENCLATVDFCKKNNLTYSPRLHIDLWGLKQGV